jgi:hypothetical protein
VGGEETAHPFISNLLAVLCHKLPDNVDDNLAASPDASKALIREVVRQQLN